MNRSSRRKSSWFGTLAFAGLIAMASSGRAGVTFITHGLDGNVDGWVTGMANRIPHYAGFPGTQFSCYKAYFFQQSGNWYLTAMRISGEPPLASDSAEIVVVFDWSQLADGNSYDTYQIAAVAVPALLSSNFLPELGGRALAEFPLHLIGHSRGGSLVCEMSRLLGRNGVWVDHLTTLDPHPLNDSEFPLDWFLYSDEDAPARTYQNVLFHDNYWQDESYPVSGLSVAGSYSRELRSFSGGYSSEHSDVHLWYHGTIDYRVPASDTEESIGSSMRTNWWNAYEANGTNAGYRYSRIGRGNRLSSDRPQGAGNPMILSGYNRVWDLGAGVAPNRTTLATNNGAWPSVIQANLLNDGPVTPGMGVPVKFFYQWTGDDTNGVLRLYLDDDLNPLNGPGVLVKQMAAPGTGGTGFIGGAQVDVFVPSDLTPRIGSLLAVIEANGRFRHVYAPESLEIVGAPSLEIALLDPSEVQVSVTSAPGLHLILERSTDLNLWQPVATNLVENSQTQFQFTRDFGIPAHFYRAVVIAP